MELVAPSPGPAGAEPKPEPFTPSLLARAMEAEMAAATARFIAAREAQDAADCVALTEDYHLLRSYAATKDTPKKLPKRSRQQACELLKRWGITYMEGAVPPRTVAKLNGTFERVYARLEARATELGHDGIDDEVRYMEVSGKDGGRVDVGLSSRVLLDEPPFNDEAIVHNPLWWPVITSMLGPDAKLSYGGVILAKCGQVESKEVDLAGEPLSKHQSWHTDGPHLFERGTMTGDDMVGGDSLEAVHLPPHIICVFVPLVDFTEDNGATQYHPGSHIVGRADKILKNKEENTAQSVRVLAPAGSAVLYDYRVLHRGTANIGPTDRNMLYLTYAAPWFEDRRFYRTTSIWNDWALAAAELEDIAIFKDSMDSWGDRFNKDEEE
jgi:hypothetical protein